MKDEADRAAGGVRRRDSVGEREREREGSQSTPANQ